MSAFVTKLHLEVVAKGRWMTLQPFLYDSDALGSRISVPAEFITDLASVPRAPFAYMITGNRARGPAVLHDWFYQHPDWEDRELADHILLEAMEVDQPELGFDAESYPIRQLIYGGVRAGGWWAWRHHGKRAEALNPEWTGGAAWPEAP